MGSRATVGAYSGSTPEAAKIVDGGPSAIANLQTHTAGPRRSLPDQSASTAE